MTANSCESNIDTLKLIHQGTSQDKRVSAQLDPTYVQVDERKIENALVFAKAYAKYLKFYDNTNSVTADWEAFFSRDVSVQLAIAAIQNVEDYKSRIKQSVDFLDNSEHDKPEKEIELKNQLAYLFSYLGTLAMQLELLRQTLPEEIKLKSTLRSLIQNQLAPALAKLISYHKAFPDSDNDFASAHVDFELFGVQTTAFSDVYHFNFSKDWITNNKPDWNSSITAIIADTSVYGIPPSSNVFTRLNHIVKHTLFTEVFDTFLKVFARVISEAKIELEKTFNQWDKHEPHYALFLAFLKLFDYARAETNTLTQRHLDFYYRDILKLKEKPAEPSHAHILIELAKHVDAHGIKADELFSAGKDDTGNEVFFANEQSFIANQAKVTELKSLYQHKPDDSLAGQNNRLFASPVANSADGLGEKLSTDKSWHPFFNKIYANGKLSNIAMPQAEIGFAIASHYLWLAEGTRTITIEFIPPTGTTINLAANQQQIICLFSTEKGWFEKAATKFATEANILKLEITLSGADPAITPYSTKTHGYHFSSNLPILLVKLRHQENADYIYSLLQNIVIETINLTVNVAGLKSLAVSNDFGSVDTSKPFQAFGAMPIKNSALIIGAKEIFQKNLNTATIHINWQNPPQPYGKTVNINIKYLKDGKWENSDITARNIQNNNFPLSSKLNTSVINEPDFSKSEPYNSNSKHGFIRLELDNDFGQSAYEQALLDYINKTLNTDNNIQNIISKIDTVEKKLTKVKTISDMSIIGQVINDSVNIRVDLNNVKNIVTSTTKPNPPLGPFIAELFLDYTTEKQIIPLNGNKIAFTQRQANFFHLTPFGQAEQYSLLPEKKIFLLAPFNHAEFYIGITGLKPPQNLALLFQVADGTANPLSTHPAIQWSYLSHNEWLEFDKYAVQDQTDGLLNSGIITFAMPDKASSNNTLLATGQHWLRATVSEKSDAVCKLLSVSAQGLKVTFQNQNNDPLFLAKTLAAETISKLKEPDAAVKKVTQPFASFGGRATEQSSAFYTRVSERLRHKDRAVTLWDYEHLILEAFPQIYQVKCLNHTRYEPKPDGSVGIYNELAAGHVTVVTIPNQQFHNLHNPLRPYTSLGLLTEIETFLQKKLSCFVKLHLKNPLFEEVSVAFKVKFHLGVDEKFHEQKLQTAITEFLSPWAYSNTGSPSFGGKIYQSVLLNFVEEQHYVDYVTDFQLFHHLIINGKTEKLLKTEIEGTKAVSILVSVPADQHQVSSVNPKETTPTATTCPCASS